MDLHPIVVSYSHTYVRDLRIVGTPTIPSEIDLLAQVDLLAWHNYFGESWNEIDDIESRGNSKPYHELSNQELTGRLRKNVAGRSVEALLQYVRTMLEDGEIEFETYFEPGKTEVFPAVGDVALLSRPQGLSLHTVTRAQWEDRGLSSDAKRS